MKDWKLLFNEETLLQGKALYQQGKAKKPSEDFDGFDAVVRDDRNYRVRIEDDGDGITGLTCTCGPAQSGRLCAHMAAALYLVEDVFGYELYADPLFEKSGAFSAPVGSSAAAPSSGAQASGKAAASAKSTPAGTAAVKQASGKAAAGKIVKIHPEGLNNLSRLLKEDAREREKAFIESGETPPEIEEYRYYNPAHFRGGLNISPKIEREARELFEKGKIGTTDMATGRFYFPGDTANRWDPDADDEECRLKIKQHSASGSWQVDQIYGRDSLLYSRCSDWNCNFGNGSDNRLGHRLCKHEVATLLIVMEALKEEDFGDPTSQSARSLLENYRERETPLFAAHFHTENGAVPKAASSTPGSRLELVPKIVIDHLNHWSIRFMIGTRRHYVVKNIPEFIADVRAGRERRFGKQTTLLLKRGNFDETGLRWLAFIEQSIRTLRLFAGENNRTHGEEIFFYEEPDGWHTLSDRIPLYGEIMDRFFDTLGNGAVETERSIYSAREVRKSKADLRTKEGNPVISLTLEPWYAPDGKVLDGVRLYGNLPEILYGSAHTYCLKEDTLLRLEDETAEKLRPLPAPPSSSARRPSSTTGRPSCTVSRRRSACRP